MINEAELLRDLAEAARNGQTLPHNWQDFQEEAQLIGGVESPAVSGIQTVIGDAIFQLILSEPSGPRFRWIRAGNEGEPQQDFPEQQGLQDGQDMVFSTLVHYMMQSLLDDPTLPKATN